MAGSIHLFQARGVGHRAEAGAGVHDHVLAVTRRLAAEALGVALVVLLLHVAFRLTTLFATGAFNDDGVYVALGQSLARGSGYRLIYLAGDPVAVKFPPGLPA